MTIKIKNPSYAVINQFGMDMRIEIDKQVEKTFTRALDFLKSEKTHGKRTFLCQPIRISVEKPNLSARKKNTSALKRKQENE